MELVLYGVLTVIIVLLVARQCKARKKKPSQDGAASALYLAQNNPQKPLRTKKPKLTVINGNTAAKVQPSDSRQAHLKLVHNKPDASRSPSENSQ